MVGTAIPASSRWAAWGFLALGLLEWPSPAVAVPMVIAEVQAIAGVQRSDDIDRGDSKVGAAAVEQTPTGEERAESLTIANAELGRLQIEASATARRSGISTTNPGNAFANARAFFRADDLVFGCDPSAPPGLCTEGVDTSVMGALRLQTEGVIRLGGFSGTLDFEAVNFLRMRGTLPGGDFALTQISPVGGPTIIDSVFAVETPPCFLGDIVSLGRPTGGNPSGETAAGEGCDLWQTANFELPLFVPIPLTLELMARNSASVRDANSSAESSTLFGESLSLPLTGPVFELPDGFTVNSKQLMIVNNRWVGGRSASVPEPISLALLGTALAGLGFGERRRERRIKAHQGVRSI